MSKNAKKQLKAPVVMKKPTCIMVPLLDLDDCLSYAIQENIISENDSNAIIEYMKCISDQAGYWDMHWGDIEEENGLSPEQAKGFRAFYELFKEHEIRDKDKIHTYPHLHFDVGVYS